VLIGVVGGGHFIVQSPDLRMESVVPRWRKRKGVVRINPSDSGDMRVRRPMVEVVTAGKVR
jgi:hypothetical protein